MNRRAVRRQYAILGVLAEKGSASARTVAETLRMNITDVVFALQLLEYYGKVASEQIPQPTPGSPPRSYRMRGL